jgi:bacterioferritin
MQDIDLDTIRDGALLGMADGPITPGYEADASAVAAALNAMLATAVVDWLRHQQHAAVVTGPGCTEAARRFADHANDQQSHIAALARRIAELDGIPDLAPANLEPRSHTAYRTYGGTDLTAMLRENLLAARVVIDVCRETIRRLDTADPTTRRLVEGILETEEHHAAGLRSLLAPSAD